MDPYFGDSDVRPPWWQWRVLKSDIALIFWLETLVLIPIRMLRATPPEVPPAFVIEALRLI